MAHGGTKMFYYTHFSPRIEDFVDAFQSVKTHLTNKIITDPELNAAAHRYIAAQTQFAKMIISNTETVLKYTLDAHKQCFKK